MINFHRLAAGFDTRDLLDAVSHDMRLWNVYEARRLAGPHVEAEDIWLRFNDWRKPYRPDDYEVVNYPAWDCLPSARETVEALARELGATRIGRSLITRLRPNKRIGAHCDEPEQTAYYDRFHVVLQSNPAVSFRCGVECVSMQAGDIWWFNNALEHDVFNGGTTPRVHLIIDLHFDGDVPSRKTQ